MSVTEKPRVLCVDDDQAVLEGLELNLRRRYEIVPALTAIDALEMIHARGPFTVILSDMRMPGMNGAEFLSKVRQTAPEPVRMLLTGYADMAAASAAVNQGQVFRFLTKPCPPQELMKAMEDAVEQFRLQTSERDLLERTLRGAVSALSEVLSLALPHSYGHSSRVRRTAMDMAERLQLSPLWPLDIAAMLGPLGIISLPSETLQRIERGDMLSVSTPEMAMRTSEVTDRLLMSIPRLEPVREIVALAAGRGSLNLSGMDHFDHDTLHRAARCLRLAIEIERLEDSGHSAEHAIAVLKGASDHFEPDLIAALEAVRGIAGSDLVVQELSARQLRVGMILDEDLYTTTGQKLVPKGYQITATFVERIKNFQPGIIREPVRALMPQVQPQAQPQEA